MNIHNRKTPRAKWHDYNGAEYFVTICTNNREHYFGEIHDGKMQLTVVGEWLKMQIENAKTHYPYVDILLYVIMPNHVHLIAVVDGEKTPYDRRDVARRVPTKPTENDIGGKNAYMQNIANYQGWLSVFVGGIKSSVTKFARQNEIPFTWQSRYHDHIIRNQDEKNKIGIYIEQNPLRWEYDCFYKND